MRKPHAAAVLALFLLVPALAQEPAGEVINVTAIELSVDVRDRNGNVPQDLKPADFVVLENGVERAVTAVEYERATRLAGTLQGEAETPATSVADDRNVLVYVDLELSNHSTMLDALRGLQKNAALLTSLGAVDVVVTNPGVQWIARGVTDDQALAAAIRKIETLPAHDRLLEHRRSVLDELKNRSQSGAALSMSLFEARSAMSAEEQIVSRFDTRLTSVLSAVPRRAFNAMFLISDGFDLDPMEFYEEFLHEPNDVAQLRTAWAGTTGRIHDEFARSLASTGWTVTVLSGGAIADFRGAASESGSAKVRAFVNNLQGSAPTFMSHRRDALLAITDATGGRIASAPPEFASAINSMGDRVRITYQVPRAPDAKPRKIEVRVKREGVKAMTSRWTSSSTPEITASARALEQLRGGPHGELPMAARIQLGIANRDKRAEGSVEVRLDVTPIGKLREQLDKATIRISFAIEGTKAPAYVIHQTIENYDLTKLQRVLYTSPINIDPDIRRIAVVMEELSSGMWGGASIDLSGSARTREFASKNWDDFDTKDIDESGGIPWMTWADGLTRAKAEQKLVVVKIAYPAVCLGCRAPKPEVYRHPAFVRMLELNFIAVRVDRDQAKAIGLTGDVGVADPSGRIRYQWEPATGVDLATKLTTVRQYAGAFLADGDTADEQFSIALAYLQTEIENARDAYAKARELAQKEHNDVLLERIETHLAIVDARTEHRDRARPVLERIASTSKNDGNAAEALLMLGFLRKGEGDAVGAADAFSRAAARAPKGSSLEIASLAQAGKDVAPIAGDTRVLKTVQLIRPRGAVIAGRVRLQTLVRDPRVDEVRFFLDDQELASDRMPPFTADLELESTPRPHTFRVEAYGTDRKLLGDDTLRVNERHDELVMKIVTPRGGDVEGKTRVELDVQRPAQASLDHVELYWNEAKIATLKQPPFAVNVIFSNKPGYIRAVAVLADGRTAEDAVTVNASGYAESIDVAVADLYARVTDSKDKPITTLTKEAFTVLDKNEAQEIVRAEYLEHPPLLLGIALDTSASMREEILDVHTTAQQFLRNAFVSEARAFVIGFDESPRLLHETTADLAALNERIESTLAQGRTTALFDALMFALLQFEGTSGKKALIVVSDGDDVSSRYTWQRVGDFARESGVALYPIIFNANLETIRPIAAMASRSGGKIFSIRSTHNLDAIYREIAAQLSQQYLLTIAPKGERKAGEHRAVDVRVSTPNATVQATPGYVVK